MFGVQVVVVIDAPPHSLKDSNASPQVETTEKEIVRVCTLTYNISGVEGRAEALGWGLGRMTSGSIIHTNLHKPNNKLVNAWLRHFWCMNEPWAYIDSQDSPRLEFLKNHHLPSYSIFCARPWGMHPNVILS